MAGGYFFNFEKFAYIKGDRPCGCILCGIRDDNPDVVSLAFAESEHCLACVNLFPFNPGHLLLFPKRHLVDLRQLDAAEAADFHAAGCALLDALAAAYGPPGFNIGFNMGSAAGGSIEHLHQQIIPRFAREIGMAELIAGQRVNVEDPRRSADRLRETVAAQGRLKPWLPKGGA